ncbi:MAG: LssY C-terminal domain-containing protein, partial [Geminicoccaceae bacterium]
MRDGGDPSRAGFPWLRLRGRRFAVATGVAIAGYLALAYGVLPLVWKEAERGRDPALAGLPKVTHDADGIPGDPLNVALVGNEAELVAAMLAAGWHAADPITLRTSLRIAESVVL